MNIFCLILLVVYALHNILRNTEQEPGVFQERISPWRYDRRSMKMMLRAKISPIQIFGFPRERDLRIDERFIGAVFYCSVLGLVISIYLHFR